MVTSIQLGNFFSSGGKTVLGGVGGSGLDTESLVNSLVTAKRLPATQLESTITANGKKTDALAQFKTLLSSLKDAASFLRNPPGVGNEAQNAFLYTTANVISNSSTPADSYISVTTSPGVQAATYNISEIHSIAQAKQQGTDDITIASPDAAFVTASATANRWTAGTVTINGQSVTFAAGDSMNQVASKLNTLKAGLGFTTSVVKVNDGTYQFVFTANAAGTAADFDLNSAGLVTSGAAAFNGFTFRERQPVSDAVFTVNGVTVTRSTNNISDLFSGVTFTLKQATPALTSLTATVGTDTSIAKNGIVNFINAYNDLRIFAAKQTQVDQNGQYTEAAVLANSTVFRNTMSSITNLLTQVVSLHNAPSLNNNAFTSTIGASPTVTLDTTGTNQSYAPGQTITITGANAVNGANVNGTWTVASVAGTTVSFVATGRTTSGAGAAGGGNAATITIADSDASRLSDVGITFADLPESADNPLVRNILDLNDGDVSAKLASNFDALRRVFEFDLESDNPNLRVYSSTQSLGTNDFTLNFTAAVAAKAKIQSTPNISIADADTAFVTASATPGAFTAGTININAGGTDVPITLNDGDTLNQVAAKFNAVSDTTGIGASVVTVSPGVLKLVFTATKTGTASDFDFNTDGGLSSGTIDGDESVFNGMVFNNDQSAVNAVTAAATATYNKGTGPVSINLDVKAITDGTSGSTIGYSLTGQKGTALEGLQLVYGSTSAATISVTATQGIADQIFSVADSTLTTDTGTLDTEVDSITSADKRLQDQIDKINDQVETYRQQLLDKFAALEQAISKVNNLLASIDADNQTRYSSGK